ncbi:glutamate dehydrogenase [Tamilnaduibacter salinus]|uniref:Glutamate dehydrogenase n=1 Tax=Tamilnaduibacter salinus TaxID=1484056 RepID=A0A2U1D1W3_9GAMM|nr:NAD-glutamate dehydrogenase [Tamilnaduibacter salinus]PVY79298.1 glutamate dehydrogenase [Tamilnaduibacter salinus]
MNAVTVSSKEQFYEELAKAFAEKLDKKQADRIGRFAEQHFSHVPLDELVSRRFSDTYGSVLAAWQFLQKRPDDEIPVSVFNPELESDGWQSTHSVIFILHPNIPFLIDSIRIAINQREIGTHTLYHSILQVERDASGNLKRVLDRDSKGKNTQFEAMIVLEIDRHSDPKELASIEDELQEVLHEVRIAVSDFSTMKDRAASILEELDHSKAKIAQDDIAEARDFLKWLMDDHFTFLGYDEYDFVKTRGGVTVRQVPESELGILRVNNERPHKVKLNDLPQRTRTEMTRTDDLFIFAKSAQRSRVHRPAYPDYIAVKKFNAKGEVTGERRFLGLYTSRVYQQRPDEIPLLRRKVASVIDRTGFLQDDYSGKELDQILVVYPRDELFQIETDELYQVALDILYIQERRMIRLFMREDVYGQFVTCLAFFPRDVYNTELRLRVEAVLRDRLEAEDIEFVTHFSESVLARVQFTIRVPQVENRQLPVSEIQDKVIALAQSWRDGLAEALHEAHGEERSNELLRLYQHSFPGSYRDMFSPRRAAIDLDHIIDVTDNGGLGMSFYRALEEDEQTVHFKLFAPDEQLPLSDVMPIFDNLGFRVIGEHPFEVVNRHNRTVWIHDFSLQAAHGEKVDIHRIRPIFEELFSRVWFGQAENDSFNRLVLTSYLTWREIALLRSYARYMQQIRITNSQRFISNTLVHHVDLARMLLEFFDVRFNPERNQSRTKSEAAQQKIEIEFNAGLDEVSNLSEDRVLRLYLDLMKASQRTNFFQSDDAGHDKSYISFKLLPNQIPDMPLPLPMFEIFVYSPHVEGVHLRGGKVARGGLRWSDRFEDYRTEILGLVKAQQVKNAVIVPVGAKGGFVAKNLPEDGGDRDAFQKAGVEAYKTFIRGLLDITDNLVEEAIQPPRQVVRHDDDDHYLVVAADKGTATFSDIANGLASEYGFWLGDAFASGGSRGYDHKKMGITAKGAWVSVERHFRELGINPQQDDFSVIGIGDMGGDVFGNGLLQSPHARLIAAFNHMHIFVDPDPDPARSFKERKRLFEMPRSAWTDYDSELISKGGGVFERSAKSIPVSEEMKKLFRIKSDRVPPNMLINHILKAKADLLWFGGIGTYVKGKQETHSDVGDKANDGIRVNGNELRCRVVGEGGNLGMTQLGRIDFALNGGRLNTDFIDNSGGVDCSDHEVNMKILLNRVVEAGDLTEKQRNVMLEKMTDDVSALVLKNNYRQAQAISIANMEAITRLEEYRRLMGSMESAGKLNRELEFLPDEETLAERKVNRQGLTRPELSVLISYVKGDLKQQLIDSELPDEPGLASEMDKVFPEALTKGFGKELGEHQLRREIIATQVANDMINHMGITFVERLAQSTGSTPPAIALAWIIAREVYGLDDWWNRIEALDDIVPANLQMTVMSELIRLIRRSVRWLLRNRRSELNIHSHMERFSTAIGEIMRNLPDYLGDQSRQEWQKHYDDLVSKDVPEDLARVASGTGHLYSALGIIEAHESTGIPLKEVAHLYYLLGEKLELNWFAGAVADLQPNSHWEALARESFREDLDWQQRALTTGVLQLAQSSGVDPIAAVDEWMTGHQALINRWHSMLTELRGTREPEYAMFSVALRELLDLAQSTIHSPLEVN